MPVMGCVLPSESLATNSGAGVEPLVKALAQLPDELALRLNFHTLPSKSPA